MLMTSNAIDSGTNSNVAITGNNIPANRKDFSMHGGIYSISLPMQLLINAVKKQNNRLNLNHYKRGKETIQREENLTKI